MPYSIDSEPWAPPRRLKIAFVVHAYNKRHGHSRYVSELAERFARNHEVHVFSHWVEVEAPPGIRFHYVPAWEWKSLTFVLSFILPATLLIRERFDIIHAQGLCGLRQNVTTAHMCQEGWFRAMRQIQGRLRLVQQLTRLLLVPLEWLTYRKWLSSRVIAISEANRRALASYYGRSQDVDVIYHGVDLDRFNPHLRERWRAPVRAELGLGDQLAALYVGDLRKGATVALEALARVPGLWLVAVSPTPSGQWEEEAARLGVRDRVVFRRESTTIERYYAAADMFLFPTFHDAFGMVITEAMAAGLPVITSRSAGASELIDNGVDGLLVDEAWDVAQLSQHLGDLALDPARRTALGRAARAKAEQYTWDRVAAETLRVYWRLCSGSS
jgi:UDP-glucose:(heptosyl)LPS alpha-1,3-glucosyltransferase